MPHTADVILQAWGPDLASCCEEAVAALLAICLNGSEAAVAGQLEFTVPAGPADAMLLDLLDEVIYVLDTEPKVPIRAEATAQSDGAMKVELQLADREAVESTGSGPKAVSRSELSVENRPGQTHCSFLVDV